MRGSCGLRLSPTQKVIPAGTKKETMADDIEDKRKKGGQNVPQEKNNKINT